MRRKLQFLLALGFSGWALVSEAFSSSEALFDRASQQEFGLRFVIQFGACLASSGLLRPFDSACVWCAGAGFQCGARGLKRDAAPR